MQAVTVRLVHPTQRVDYGVARGENVSIGHRFAPQVGCRSRRRRKMVRRQGRDELAVRLFGKRGIALAGAQARFDVADWNALVECGERTRVGAGRVALDEQVVRPLTSDDGTE